MTHAPPPLPPGSPLTPPGPLQLRGAPNFRSLQGLRARDGRSVREHAVLRSDQLCHLDAQDLALLRGLGLRTVFDLRSPAERQRFPNRLPDGVLEQALPVLADVRADDGLAEIVRRQPDPQGVRQMMLAVYRRLPAALAPHLPALFGALEREAVPMLVHCAAGKDRTGFAVAVLLHALDVPDDRVMADYLLSSRLATDPHPALREKLSHLLEGLLGTPASDAMVRSLIEVEPAYLHAAYGAVQAQWGSMDGYLSRTCGLGAARLQRLRDRWLAAPA